MPEFPTTPLVNHFEIEIGGTPSRDKPEYWSTEGSPGHKWMAISDFGPRRITETAEQVSESGFRHSNAKRVSEGTLMMSFKLTIGRVAFAGCDLLTNEAIAAFVPKDGEIVPDFLYHVLPGVALGAISDTAIKGATLNKAKLRKLPIPKPAPSVQRRIAKILTTVDNQIEKTEALIAKYQSIKQGLMHDLFTRGVDEHGHLRPSRDQAPQLYKESELGWIPKEWTLEQASRVCREIVVGIVIQPARHYVNEGVPALRSANVREDGVVWGDMVFISEASNRLLSKSSLKAGDLVSVRTGYPGTTAVIPPSLDGCNCVDLIISRPGPRIRAEYLSLWINSDFGKGQVLQGQGGLAQQHFNVGEMKELLVAVPTLKEQEVIEERLWSIRRRMRTEIAHLSKLRSLKLGLMQDLLTGKVPVKPEHSDQDNGITPNGATKAGVKSRGEGIHA